MVWKGLTEKIREELEEGKKILNYILQKMGLLVLA